MRRTHVLHYQKNFQSVSIRLVPNAQSMIDNGETRSPTFFLFSRYVLQKAIALILLSCSRALIARA